MANNGQLPQKNALEWSVFAFSLLLVLAAVGYLAYSALNVDSRPPELTVTLGEPQAGGDSSFHVPVIVENTGGHSVEEVQVEVTLEENGETVETAELAFPLVAYQSGVEGTASFKTDPSSGQLSARVLGYLKP